MLWSYGQFGVCQTQYRQPLTILDIVLSDASLLPVNVSMTFLKTKKNLAVSPKAIMTRYCFGYEKSAVPESLARLFP